MKQSGYDDLVIKYSEVDSVRESSDQTAPEVFVYFLIQEGITGNITGAGIEHAKKFISESRCFRFIPRIAADRISFDFRQKTKCVGHFLFSILI